MNIKLKKLFIENFKGIRVFEMNFDGRNFEVYGDNETGKTTLVDAFQWVLFDKDSDGNSKFSIKPIDKKTKKERHHLETLVEIIISLDGKDLTLKKIYKEKWVKPNGSAEQEFTGHTTDYFIDGVPKRQTDYKKKVAEIVNEEVFKMITNVLYFNEIDWKKRRDIVLSLCPELPVDKVIKYKPELRHIKDELEEKDVNDLLEIYKAERKKQNDLLKEIPIRIDELHKNDFSTLENYNLEDVNSQIKTLNAKLDDIKIKKSQNNLKNEILNLEAEIKNLNIDKRELESFKSDKQEKLEKVVTEGKEIANKIDEIKTKIKHLESDIEFEKQNEQSLLSRKQKLYDEYDVEMAKHFQDDVCVYCGQTLQQDKIDELQKHFNTKKVEKLEEIREKGLKINEQVKSYQEKVLNAQEEITKLITNLNDLKIQRQHKLDEYEKINGIKEVNPNLERIKTINTKILDLQEKLSLFQNKENVNPFAEDEAKINQKLESLNNLLNIYNQKQFVDKRIYDLELQKKEAGSGYSIANNKVVLCEMFIAAKAELLENTINSNFEIVEFKLFDIQINGGISETCIATINGVPFSDVNNASKVNAGLDIIKALQNIYNVKAPIFIDNAESVTKYLDMGDTQMIKLYVSKGDAELRFETDADLEEAA